MPLLFDAPLHARFDGSFRAVGALASTFGRPIWIFDLEATTGDVADPQFGVVELGFVRVEPDGTSTDGSYLIDAGFPMNAYASQITGIKTSTYHGSPSFAHFWPQIEQAMRTCVVSGFGVHDFDCRALFHEAARAQLTPFLPFHFQTLDARALWRSYSGAERGQLGQIAEAFGFVPPGLHRALTDARAAAVCLEGLLRLNGVAWARGMAQTAWHPWAAAELVRARSLALSSAFSAALDEALGAGDFAHGIKLLAGRGVSTLGRRHGLSWFFNGVEILPEFAPASLDALASHFSCPLPLELSLHTPIDRCTALLTNFAGALTDTEIASRALCKPSAADSARAQMIESGALAAWTGVDAAWRERAACIDPLLFHENSVFDVLRSGLNPDERLAPPPAGLHAASASIARELGHEKRWSGRRVHSAKP